MNSDIANFWQKLQRIASDILSKEVQLLSEVAYFDYPVYSNVGDLLIWMGTEKWIENNGISVLCRMNVDDGHFPVLEPSTIILCQGGGNFGDLYKHQPYREKIVLTYPNNKIIFLPQTIYYQNPLNLTETANVLNQHSNLVIYLRDDRSIKIARENFHKARLYSCPDMATFLYPVSPIFSKKTKNKNIFLLRKDVERSSHELSIPKDAWVGDWAKITGSAFFLIKVFQLSNITFLKLFSTKVTFFIWKHLATHIVMKSVRYFISAGNVTTSRLHGHILALLLGKPVTLLDNSYGKNESYYKKWHKDCLLVTLNKS